MGEVIQFPNIRKVVQADKIDRMEHRLTELENENAWIKDYDYTWGPDNNDSNWRFENKLTDERIPLTEAQYDDNNYTIERAR